MSEGDGRVWFSVFPPAYHQPPFHPHSYGASVTNVFGPLIIKSFGFNSRKTILLNIPFGFMQTVCILGLAFAATKFSKKSISLGILVIPCITGAGLLYGLGRTKSVVGPLLFGY